MTPFDFHISEKDMDWLMKVAKDRNDIKKDRVPTQKVDPGHTDEQAHQLGVMAEFAVATPLGLGINAVPMLGGDGGRVDLWLPDRRSIAVKGVWTLGLPLYFRRKEDFRADLAVLGAKVGPRVIRICGWITRAKFLFFVREQPLKKDCPPVWAVPLDLLTPFEDLIVSVRMWARAMQAIPDADQVY